MEHVIAYPLKDFKSVQMDRRHLMQVMGLSAGAAFAVSALPRAVFAAGAAQKATTGGKGFKALAWNHLSFDVADVAKSRDWYADLFGMKVTWDDGIPPPNQQPILRSTSVIHQQWTPCTSATSKPAKRRVSIT